MRIRHFLVLAAVTLFAAFGPPERTTPAKWALVVGVGDYIHFGDELGGDLPGAGNDARAVADVLVNRYGFDPANVKLVLDHEATRERLDSELSGWLPSVARPGDLVWFYFAGHGSQAWDMDGDEADGLDETVCPADVMRGNTEMDILDDEIGVWLNQLPTDNVVVVWDKCHAKSSTRAVTPFARPRSLDRKVKEDVAKPSDATEGQVAGVTEDGGGTQSGILEIASAQADEVAIDAAFPGENGGETTYGGAFTTPFVQNLWNAGEDATYDQVFNKTRQDMRRNRFRQQPDIGEKDLKDRPLFWVAPTDAPVADASDAGGAVTAAPTAANGSARVIEVPSENRAVLAGGYNADMTAGSIYSLGTDVLEITDVTVDRGTARVASRETRGIGVSRGGRLASGAFARLVAYNYPEARLQVNVAAVPSHVRGPLIERVSGVPALTLAQNESAFAHLIVLPRSGHYVVVNLDGFPRDSVAAGPGSDEALAQLLRREYGQYQLAELENPAQPFAVEFAFADGRSEFRLGEPVSFAVTSERDGYLTIVDLSSDGKASVIFPNEVTPEGRVYAGRTLRFPEFTAIPPTGRGIVRAFVTERPLVMPFASGASATEADRVWTALRNAAGRPPIQGSPAIPVQNWATSAIVYEIRP